MPETDEFKNAFSLCMKFEVGPGFNPRDPETRAGLFSTAQQKRKVGYVNHPDDPGGETKFGIAQNMTKVNVQKLTLKQAEDFYFVMFWDRLHCEQLKSPISLFLFDAAVNHGTSQGVKFLQRAVRSAPDGQIGPNTINACNKLPVKDVCVNMLNEREQFYHNLVAARPKMQVFLKGWLSRVEYLREYTKLVVVPIKPNV